MPIMIDSVEWSAIEAGLKCLQGKSIVNSISLKNGEQEFETHARKAKAFGAAVVVLAFDERGQASSFERKIEIAERSYNILTEQVGMSPSDIVFDCCILAIGSGIREHDNYAVDFLNAVRWIKENLPNCLTICGVSNLSFAFRADNKLRNAIHSVFLHHATKYG